MNKNILYSKLKKISAEIAGGLDGYTFMHLVLGTLFKKSKLFNPQNRQHAECLHTYNEVCNMSTIDANRIKIIFDRHIENGYEYDGDVLGDAYEFLIDSKSIKSGGEFFTPQQVSKLIVKLALHKQDKVNKIYDPACGSGSLLLQAKKAFNTHILQDGFFGQELNHTTYNLARMNMFLHDINYDKFNIQLGDTLIKPHFGNDTPFDAIVSNPPYSVKWVGSDDSTLINDDRFSPAGVLAPKSKADFAFVMHALSYLSSKGRAAIVCFPGIFYRGGTEQKIRKYLVDNNYVETVIALPPNLFYGTSIAVTILVLDKNKQNTDIQFMDASGEQFFKKATNTNIMTDNHIGAIIDMFDTKENIPHVAQSVAYDQVIDNEYNLSVSSYISIPPPPPIDIKKLNAEVRKSHERIRKNLQAWDDLIDEMEKFGI